MKPVFIYALLDPRTKETRYVGQAVDPDTRLGEHVRHAKKKRYHSERWVNCLRRKPIMEILDVVPDNEADFWEREYIQNFRERGFRLTNFSEGGGTPMRGKKHSLETKAKISAAKLGEKTSLEMRAKMRASHLGKKASLETREKMSASHTGLKHSSETKVKMRAVQLGKKLSPETKAKISAARKRK